jgi:hypothetical protein
MNTYIDLNRSLLPKHFLTELASKGGGIYLADKILKLLKDTKCRSILKKLMVNYDEIILDFIELQKIDQTHWQLTDNQHEYMQELIRLINNLPWDIDDNPFKINKDFISTIIDQRNKITSYGDDLGSFSENDLDWITENVYHNYGKLIDINFNSIKEIISIIDNAVIKLCLYQME